MTNVQISNDDRFRPPGERSTTPITQIAQPSLDKLAVPTADKAAFELEPDRSLIRDIWSKIKSIEWSNIKRWPVAAFQSERALENIQRISASIHNPAPITAWETLLDNVDQRVGAQIRNNLHEVGAVVGTTYVSHMREPRSRFFEVEAAVEFVAGVPLTELSPSVFRGLSVKQKYDIHQLYKRCGQLFSELSTAHHSAGERINEISASVADIVNADLSIRHDVLPSLPRSLKALYNRVRHGVYDQLGASGGVTSADPKGTLDSLGRARAELLNSVDTIKQVGESLTEVHAVLDKNAKTRSMLNHGVPEKIEEERIAVVSPELLDKVRTWFDQGTTASEKTIDPTLKSLQTLDDCATWQGQAEVFVRDNARYHEAVEAIGWIFLPFTTHTENEHASVRFKDAVTKMRESIEKEVAPLLDGTKPFGEVMVELKSIQSKAESLADYAGKLSTVHEMIAKNSKVDSLLTDFGVPTNITHEGIADASKEFRAKLRGWLNKETMSLGSTVESAFYDDSAAFDVTTWARAADEFQRKSMHKHAMIEAMAEAIEPLSTLLLALDRKADPLMAKAVIDVGRTMEKEILSTLGTDPSGSEFFTKMADLRKLAEQKVTRAEAFMAKGKPLDERGRKQAVAEFRKRIDELTPVDSF